MTDILLGGKCTSAGGYNGTQRGREELPHVRGQGQKARGPHMPEGRQPRGATPHPRSGAAAGRIYPPPEARGRWLGSLSRNGINAPKIGGQRRESQLGNKALRPAPSHGQRTDQGQGAGLPEPSSHVPPPSPREGRGKEQNPTVKTVTPIFCPACFAHF